ncbi:MAG: hypothetical protein KF754_00145 [Planctomycetes bacterium]|nr:hypothetical protein [Planctomycetota bacterium]
MRKSWPMLVVVLLAGAAAGLWLALRPAPSPGLTPGDQGPTAAARASSNVPASRDSGNSARPEGQPEVRPRAAPPPQVEPEIPEADPNWHVRGRVAAVQFQGLNLLDVLSQRKLEVFLSVVWEEGDKYEIAEESVETDVHRRFELPDFLSREEHPDLRKLMWQFHVREHGEGTLVRFMYACDWCVPAPGEQPDPATITGLHRPTWKDGWVDFGDIHISLDGLESPPMLLTGRVLVPGGKPLVSRQALTLTAGEPEHEEEQSFETSANGQGRFAVLVPSWPDDPVDAEAMAALPWRLQVGQGDGHWDFEYSMRRGYLEGLEEIPLPAPQRNGNVLDFGDVLTKGAVLEILAQIDGHPIKPAAADWLLQDFEGEGPTTTTALLYLTAGDDDFSVEIAIGLPLRLLVPEARYNWVAELDMPDCPCRPHKGSIGARIGTTSGLEINFSPAPLIPVRVIAPQDVPLDDLEVNWSIELHEEDWWSGPFTKDHKVPLLTGFVTEVEAELPGYAPVTATAKSGSTEVVLEFSQVAAPTTTLIVKLPLLPAVLGERMIASLRYSIEQVSSNTRNCTLQSGGQALETCTGVEPGMYQLRLSCADAFGYPGGVLSSLDGVVLEEGQTVTVEMPAIEAPPWSRPAVKVTASVKVSGKPASLSGKWDFGPGQYSRTISDKEQLTWASDVQQGKGTGSGSVPAAFVHGELRQPVRTNPPAEAWGETTAVIDLPVRLRLRATRGGLPVHEFSAGLSLYDGVFSTTCRAAAMEGVVFLWCPPGDCDLVLHCEDQRVHSQKVAIPASGEVELVVTLDRVRVTVRAEGESGRVEWYIGLAQHDKSYMHRIWGETTLFLAPGIYRFVPGEPADPAAAVTVDLTDGKDREVVLPQLDLPESVGVMLTMTESDWRGFETSSFAYSIVFNPDAGKSGDFAGSATATGVRPMPDGLMVRDLPQGRRVLLRGWYSRRVDGKLQYRVMKPADIVVTSDMKLDPKWTEGSSLDWEWDEPDLRCVSDFAGFHVYFGVEQIVAAGRHELVFKNHAGEEVLRVWVEIPAGVQEFLIPPDLRKRLEDAEVIEARPPDDMEEE